MQNEKTFNGFMMDGVAAILVMIALGLLAGGLIWMNPDLVWVGIVVFVAISIASPGFVLIEPNQACAMLLFGKYQGTLKRNGFFLTNPFFSKKKISQRAYNLDVDPVKVNDKQGNPIMIGLIIVWRIEDTYKALFEIETTIYEQFVRVQSDAALRKIAGMYPYDNSDNDHHELTLRGGGEEINQHLETELQERLHIAGIQVIEARINYLAYSSEIAGAMLRRQQATAIIAAREKIVEGAVSMVQLALKKLSEEKVIDLDEDKKAAMVSNLMVVLCADDSVQPIINTGTLYQ